MDLLHSLKLCRIDNRLDEVLLRLVLQTRNRVLSLISTWIVQTLFDFEPDEHFFVLTHL
jgi:hypothetical protein